MSWTVVVLHSTVNYGPTGTLRPITVMHSCEADPPFVSTRPPGVSIRRWYRHSAVDVIRCEVYYIFGDTAADRSRTSVCARHASSLQYNGIYLAYLEVHNSKHSAGSVGTVSHLLRRKPEEAFRSMFEYGG